MGTHHGLIKGTFEVDQRVPYPGDRDFWRGLLDCSYLSDFFKRFINDLSCLIRCMS